MRAGKTGAGRDGRARAPYGLMWLRRWMRRGGCVLSLPAVLALLLFQAFGGCTCPDVAAHGMPADTESAVAAGMAHHPESAAAAKGHRFHHFGPACGCCGAGLCGGVGLLPRAPALPDLHVLPPAASLVLTADRPAVAHDGHLRPPARAPPFSF